MASTDDEAELLVLGYIDRSLNSEVGVRLLEGNVLAQARVDALKVRTAVGRTLGERPRHNHLGDRRWPAHKFFRKALIAYRRPTAFPPLHLGNFGATLRDHQEDGVKEMVFLESTMGGGLLADDMGLGKTIQVLALIAQDRKPPNIERTPTLIVVEKSLMLQWQREIEKVMPRNHFKYAAHGNLKSKDGFPHSMDMSYDHFRQLDIVLVTYETVEYEHDKVSQWQEEEEASVFDERQPTRSLWTTGLDTERPESYIYGLEWYRIVLDEAHRIRVHDSRITKAICSPLLGNGLRWGITGTPFQNYYRDLFAYFALLRIEPWNDFKYFRATFDRGGDGTLSLTIPRGRKRDMLHIILMSFTIRRLQNVLRPALPILTEKRVHFRLRKDLKIEALLPQNIAEFENEWATQNKISHKIPNTVRDFPVRAVQSADYVYARMSCTHYAIREAYTKNAPGANVDADEDFPDTNSKICPGWETAMRKDNRYNSTKIKLAVKIAKNQRLLHNSQGSTIVFDAFIGSLCALKIALEAGGIASAFIHGGVNDGNRDQIIDDFNNQIGPRILLATEDVMGSGHNLTVAVTVIILSPSYSPEVTRQLIGRAHRIGQHQEVTVWYFTANDSVETIIETRHQATRIEQRNLIFSRDLEETVEWYQEHCRTFQDFCEVTREWLWERGEE